MDPTTLKISLAALMHDMGKFADKKALDITEKYMMDNEGEYQPVYDGRPSHPHAVYTAAFVEYLKDMLPPELNSPQWGEGDSFINLAAGHHKPQTPMQWIIAIADRVSSGWDRKEFDEYNRQIPWGDYKKTRLLPLFEKLQINHKKPMKTRQGFNYCYPLKQLSPLDIFPAPRSETEPENRAEAEQEYLNLFDQFQRALSRLFHKNENLELWLDHFESLLMLYTSSVPSARAGNIIPDVSLYDHAKSTAALAAALYAYHRDTNTITVEAIKNFAHKKFLVITGDFYGIQSFIFRMHGDTRRYRSKLLRGRSFSISLFTELAADMLCREIGIPTTSSILNAAGKFTVIAPNTSTTDEAVKKVEKEVNDWLIEISYGESSMGFSRVEASPDDFVKGRFVNLWEALQKNIGEKKFSRLDLEKHAGAFTHYLDSFDNSLDQLLCPFCGKRPSSQEAIDSKYIDREEAGGCCSVCRDQVFLGANLVKKKQLAVTSVAEGSLTQDKENRLQMPIFNRYQVSFQDEDLNDSALSGELLRYWRLSYPSEDEDEPRIAVRFVSGYVPAYAEDDQSDPRYEKKARDEANPKTDEQRKVGDPKTLNDIASMSLTRDDRSGLEALGVFKADVDNLGLLMACGLAKEEFTLSRISTLSRQLDAYFSVYLPRFLQTSPDFKNIYTVFAGGDDFFLIGPWNSTIKLAHHLRESFKDYVCQNDDIHFSAGITLHKSHTPIDSMAESAESALEKSKAEDRDRLTLFAETATWEEVIQLAEIKAAFEEWLEQNWINKAMLYRLNELIQMAEQEKRLVNAGHIHVSDLACMRWRALLAYSLERNIGKDIRKDAREKAIREVRNKLAQWILDYGAKLKMPLWETIYTIRR